MSCIPVRSKVLRFLIIVTLKGVVALIDASYRIKKPSGTKK